MSQPKPDLSGLNIVLVGSFNPQIFQPAWFAAENLIRKEEGEAAKIELVHAEFVSFTLDWLQLQVTRDRFIASTTKESHHEALRDFVMGTFRLLSHTPIKQMGLNLDLHFLMKSEDEWHAFGHRLAPKEPWAGILEKPGMRSLHMQGVRPDKFKGYILVRAEPSVRIQPGVFVSVNDHYEVDDPNSSQGCNEIMNILTQGWQLSLRHSKEIVFSLLEQK